MWDRVAGSISFYSFVHRPLKAGSDLNIFMLLTAWLIANNFFYSEFLEFVFMSAKVLRAESYEARFWVGNVNWSIFLPNIFDYLWRSIEGRFSIAVQWRLESYFDAEWLPNQIEILISNSIMSDMLCEQPLAWIILSSLMIGFTLSANEQHSNR